MTDPAEALPPGLMRRRAQARIVLLFERVWPAIWPALGAAGLFLCAALLDLPSLLPGWAHIALLVVAGLLILGLLLRGLSRIALPRESDADRRLEHASGLRHRPLAVFADRPALPGADRLWAAHVARATAAIGRLRVGPPRPGLPARDPRAFRAAVAIAVVACLVIAGPDTGLRLARAVTPGFPPAAAPPATEIQAWITPPGYTGMAPLFLKPDQADVTAPAGSHLTISVTGGTGTPTLTLDGRKQDFRTLDVGSFQADQDLTAGGKLAVARDGKKLGDWDLTVVADRAPEVHFPEPPGAVAGRVPQTRLPWQVAHEYGVTGLQAELRLADRPGDPPLIIAIPLPSGAAKAAKGVRLQDLTANPWSGLPVIARLIARDAAGMTGTSEEARFALPERRFQNDTARALMLVRKQLTLTPEDRKFAIAALDAIAGRDDVWHDDAGGFLNLSAIQALLSHDPAPAAVPLAQARMWELALHLEEGAGERTARALDQARQALRELLDAQKRGENVDKTELDRRMQDVQQALEKRLQALAEQARQDPDSQQFDPDRSPLDARDMQRLAEQMREDAKQGKMDDARQKMAELDRMLAEMQKARPEHGQMTEAQKQRAEKRQRGQQQMNALQDIVQRQGSLLDHSERRAGPSDPTSKNADSQNTRDGQERKTDQTIQQALRRALGELMQQYGDLTGKIPPNLGDADAAMRDSGQALAQSQDSTAATAERKAIEALQKGGQSMGQQMAQQFGRGQQPGEEGDGDQDGDQDGDGQGQMAGTQPGGDQPGGDSYGNTPGGRPWNGTRNADRRGDRGRDPLGRPLQPGISGLDDSDDVQVPEQMEQARSRAIQEELRRRDADRTRPQPELDYLGRLLQQF